MFAIAKDSINFPQEFVEWNVISVINPLPTPLIEIKPDQQAPNAAQWNEIKAIEQLTIL